MNNHQHKILILDFGSQYAQLIARRVRKLGIYCEIWAWDVNEELIKAFAPQGIILSGGPETVVLASAPRAPSIIFTLGIPVLGICYGMQTMAHQLGGRVEPSSHREFGYAQVTVLQNNRFFENIEDDTDEQGRAKLDVWMSHGDKVVEIPQGFEIAAATDHCAVAAMVDSTRNFYGVQFHPEVTHTRQGLRMLEHFVHNVCRCESLWTTRHIIAEQVNQIRAKVGNVKIILALSGGVDSSVATLLLHQAVGHQLTCIFVDTGLLRLHEADQVRQTFSKHFGIPLLVIDAKQQFLKALQGVSDPELKRKIIGKVFIDVFAEQASKLENIQWFAQGTIYSDVIESAGTQTGKAHVIKSHHNVGGLPDILPFKLLEPLRELFKDEVREIGLELGLSYSMLYRHPFPGAGLGVRILGEIQQDYVDKLRVADHIFMEELYKHDLYDKVSQAFCVFLPVKSVGVVGDARQYEPVIALRAVETVDFMTARWAHLPYEFLEIVSLRIVNEVRGISRVVYDISGKPPATIEWE